MTREEIISTIEHYDRHNIHGAEYAADAILAKLGEEKPKESFPTNDELAYIGVIGRKVSISKHRAMNRVHLKEVIEQLDAANLNTIADTIVWCLWFRVLDHQREEFLVSDANDRATKAEAALAAAESNAAAWHRACETILTLNGLPCALDATEAAQAVQDALATTAEQLKVLEEMVEHLKQSLADQSSARLDAAMPLIRPEVLEHLRHDAEAQYAMASGRDERVQAHALSLLCVWQDRARAALREKADV